MTTEETTQKKRAQRHRQYCFTFWCDDHYVDINTARVRYYVYQQEVSKEGATHLQGYMQLTEPLTFMQVKKLFGHEKWETVHLAPARGSTKQNREYCTKVTNKDGSPARSENSEVFEYGIPIAEGQNKGSILDAAVMLKNGASMEEVEEQFPGVVTLHREKLATNLMMRKKRQAAAFRSVYVEVRYGDAGTGKTHSVMADYGKESVFKKSASSGKWWNLYNGEPVLLLDEFYGQIQLPILLGILDGYELQLEIKGGMTYAEWTHVVITSNIPMEQWYPDAKADQLKALYDRVKKVTEYRGKSKRSDQVCVPYPTLKEREQQRIFAEEADGQMIHHADEEEEYDFFVHEDYSIETLFDADTWFAAEWEEMMDEGASLIDEEECPAPVTTPTQQPEQAGEMECARLMTNVAIDGDKNVQKSKEEWKAIWEEMNREDDE